MIFQTLWLRLSGLVFGNSVWSAALILSSFMAGLAIGSAIAAKLRLQWIRPLHLYLILEILIAVAGCTIVFGLPVLGQLLRPIFQILWSHDGILNVIRLTLSFVILLLPTTAMGLTLPVLLDDAFLARYDFGRLTSLLYGANALGAVGGAIIGEAYLVRAFGIWGTSLVAGLLNCTAAFAAFLLARLDLFSSIAPSQRQQFDLRLKVLPWRLLVVSFGSGGILLCLEVVWFRFLRLYVASSSTAFALMLAVVLAGIGLGGLVSGIVRRHIGRFHWLIPILLLSAAIATLLCYIFFPLPTLTDPTANYFFESWREIVVPSIFLMFPVALLSGILFPTVVALVQNRIESRMNSIGFVTLLNTIGAAIGPLAATFLLLPAIGFQWSIILCAAGYVGLGLILPNSEDWSLRKPSGAIMIGLIVTLIAIMGLFPYHRDERHFANARRSYEAIGEHLKKRIEGNSDTYQLLERDIYGEPYYYRLAANAFSLANTESSNQRYMRLFAYLPIIFRPESREALLICYGCGVTADALTHFSGLREIDVVDISKEVISLAPYYVGQNQPDALEDPRVKIFIQDGRFFLQAAPRQYDIITGEPPPPKVAGTVNLYTQEFFGLMKNRLKDGGIASFWLPIAELKVDETKAILRAFHNVFPTVSVWASGDNEWIMVGVNGEGQPLSEEKMRDLWKNPSTGEDLKRIGVETPEQVASLFLMDGEEIDRVTKESAPLTDSFPKRLSDDPPDMDNVRRFAWNYMEGAVAARSFHLSPLMRRIWPDSMRAGLEPLFVVREARYLSGTALHGSNKLAELDLYLRHSKLRAPVLEVLRTDEFRIAIAKRKAAGSTPPEPELMPDLTADALAERDFPRAINLLDEKRTRGLAVRNDMFLLIYLDCLAGKVETAETLAANMNSSRSDWFVDWLWGKLQAEFGFRPPA